MDQAINDLSYLLRTAPSLNQEVRYKLALTFFLRSEPDKTLDLLGPLLPSIKEEITDLAMQAFLSLDDQKKSIQILINSSLNNQEKSKLYQKYFIERDLVQRLPPPLPLIDLYCVNCGGHLFFYHQRTYCLVCNSVYLSKFLA